jgi:hypothetical protein
MVTGTCGTMTGLAGKMYRWVKVRVLSMLGFTMCCYFSVKHLAELNCRILEPSILFAQVNPAVSNVLGL